MRWCAVVLVAVWIAVASPAGWANGVYYPEQAVVEMPRVPLQRALITYRNGEETLVLESALTTASAQVGWIVPLPGEPTRVELGDPDMLRLLAASQGPEVVHDLSEHIGLPVLVLIGIIPLSLALIFTRDPLRKSGFWVLAGTLLFFGIVVTPQFTNAGSSPADAAQMLAVHRLGEVEAAVLRAKTPEALDAWLAEQGLAKLGDGAQGIVQQYIERNWCFVVSRLAAPGQHAGQMVPRPLVMRFATTECVFPMRLTQLAGGTTRVELYIAADQRAQATGFRCVSADMYRRVKTEHWNEYPVYEGTQTKLAITHPDLQEFLWDGCTLTHLVADLTPAQMTADVSIGFRAAPAYRERVYTTRARWELTQVAGYWSAVAVVVVATGVFIGRRWPGRAGRAWLIGTVLAGAAVTASIGWTLPVVPAVAKMRIYLDSVNSDLNARLAMLEVAALNGTVNDTTPLEEVLPTLVAKKQFSVGVLQNPVTREPIRYERTPGNMSMRTVNGRKYLCLYMADGYERKVPLSPAGTTE